MSQLSRLLPALAAALLVSVTAVHAASPPDLGDNVLRSACVMVTAHITRQGAPPIASATGTGFFVAPDLILTCNHCTRIPMPRGMVNANDVQVELDGGTFVRARVIGRDPAHDLALLKIDRTSAARAECKPLPLSPRFSLRSGSAISIVGNFPEAIRVTRGELVARSVMRGFAMGSAKVRSGFSGGPVLDENGAVQGILSQRDDDNNSIFVRADVIHNLLDRHQVAWVSPEDVDAPTPATETKVASAREEQKPSRARAEEDESQQTAAAKPRTSVSESAEAAENADSAPPSPDPVVVALPVRPASVTEVSEKEK